MSLNGTAAIIVPIYEGLVKEIKSFLIHLYKFISTGTEHLTELMTTIISSLWQ